VQNLRLLAEKLYGKVKGRASTSFRKRGGGTRTLLRAENRPAQGAQWLPGKFSVNKSSRAFGAAFCCFLCICVPLAVWLAEVEVRMFIELDQVRTFVRRQLMNWDQVEGKWKQSKGKFREKWGKLTDDDLTVISGKRDQLVGRLQERYGIAREEAERQADAFVQGMNEQEEVAATRTTAAKNS
jgi:uncharacterized protein YjbJ (UPF0337 family)